MKNILIRCDASKRIGFGHVTRCLVLAKEFQKKNCTVYFAMKNYQLGIEKVRDENFSIVLFDESLSYNDWILKVADKKNIDIFIGDIRDGFPTQTIKTLKTKKILTVAIDEPSEYAKECDICFYPPHAIIDEKLYKGQVFQGFEYVLLREEFYTQYEKKEHKIPNILVMMGGTDAYNLTYSIVKQLVDLKKKMNIKVIINKNHPDYDKIKNIDKNISISSDIRNMAEFLQEIDFGIISFGVSAYELLVMQIPALHICLDEEHWSASEVFEKKGLASAYRKEEIQNIKKLNMKKSFVFSMNKNTISNIIMNQDKYIISVGAGTSQVPLIKEIKKLGYKVISSDLDQNAPAKNMSDIFYNISTYEAEKLIELLKKETVAIVGILTRATGQPVVTVSKIAQKFHYKALDVQNAMLFSNKSLLMQKLNSLNIPSPNAMIVTNTPNRHLHFPVFVKPSKTVLSHAAMYKCMNEIELKQSIESAMKISETGEVNVEEYLVGRDVVCIDFIFHEEIIHVTNIGEISSGEPSFDGIGWYTISHDYADLANKSFINMKNTLKIKNVFLQTAMKVNIKENSAKIYEVHAEIGGDKVNDVFIPYVLNGYNIFEENIKLAVNKKPSSPLYKAKLIIMLFENKIKEYDINVQDYKVFNGTYIKEFSTFKELEKELGALSKEGVSIDNYLEDADK